MCKEHHKEEHTLIAGIGEKLVFNRPNQEKIEKSRAVVLPLFKVPSVHISQVLPIFTPFRFSVFSLGLGLLAWDQASQ